jgi:hypothetical protein
MRTYSVSLLVGMIGAVAAGSAVRADGASTRIAAIPYGECLSIIDEASREVSEQPINLVNTGDMRVVRINAADGFVTIACSRADNRMILTKSAVPAAAGMTASR